MKKSQSTIIALVLVSLFAVQSFGGESGRLIRSIAFPGMGQLGDGGGELTSASTLKGLGFMAGEVALLSLTFSKLSYKNAKARDTDYLQYKYQMATTYEDRALIYDRWKAAYNESNSSTMLVYAFGGGAVAWWLINVADIMLFKPADGETSMLKNVRDNTMVQVSADGASLTYRWMF